MVGQDAGDVHQSFAEGPASIGHPPGSATSRGGDELQRAGLLGPIVERASEALAAGAQRAQPVPVLHDRVHRCPLRAGRVALRLAAQEQLGDAVLRLLARAACAAAHRVARAVRVELVEDRAQLALRAALRGEPVAEALELRVLSGLTDYADIGCDPASKVAISPTRSA